MNKVKLIGAIAALIISVGVAQAAFLLGWADEFTGAIVECDLATSSGTCLTRPVLDGLQTGSLPRWEYIGQQGANTTGRQNAREKAMFRFRDMTTGTCNSACAAIYRYRLLFPPAAGSPCTSSGGQYVGYMMQCFNSCPNNADTLVQGRLLPSFDFSAETAAGGTTIGYYTNTYAWIGSGYTTNTGGCYRIKWN